VRSALLSTLELTQAGRPRAFERLGGRSLIAWQVDMARDLGCTRIICLAQRDSEPLQDLHESVESAGLEFQLVRGPLPLARLLSADQELVVIADGLVIDRERLAATIGEQRGVAALPAEEGLAAGFERIDADHAWGGVLVTRARIAEQLADMPPDCDTISVLLRLALQAGARLVNVSAEALDSGEWLLVRDRAVLAMREEALLDRSVESAAWSAPGTALSRRIARALAPDALDRGPATALGLGALGLLGAVVLAQLGLSLAGLTSFIVGAFTLKLGEALGRLKARLRGIGPGTRRADLLRNILDFSLVMALSLPFELDSLPQRMFLPLMFVGLLRLGESLAPEKWRAAWGDRLLAASILLPAAWFGVLDQAVAGLSLLALGLCLFFRRESKITRA